MQSEAWPLYFKINVYYDIHNVVLTRQARWKTEGISWKVLKAVYIWKKKTKQKEKDNRCHKFWLQKWWHFSKLQPLNLRDIEWWS